MTTPPRCTLDGATVDAVPTSFALHGFGVFTTFVAVDGAVLGWSTHLERLVEGAARLWGHHVNREQVRDLVRAHLREDSRPTSVRVSLFPEHFVIAAPEDAAGAHVLITSSPAVLSGQPTPDMRVQTVLHERPLAHLKTTALLPLIALRREARLAGYDDALLCAGDQVLEGTTWNVLVWHESEVATPDAGVLPGSTLSQIGVLAERFGYRFLRRAVSRNELATADLVLGVSVNHPARAIVSVDGGALAVDRDLQAALAAGYAALPRDVV
ncbi:MAG: aminotransferase class IV [Nocardioidaceae bacterium]|nr:aminotransferase class IV [Nocardioidaceae bacterium]